MPAPLSRSTPAPSMSMTPVRRDDFSCACVAAGAADFTSAAIAPACGAAAEVPKNGLNPCAPQRTPSAAVKSGFCCTSPPVADTSPGVIGVESAL